MPDTREKTLEQLQREKLIELLGADTCKHDCCEDCEYGENRDACIDFLKKSMADYLIANGVTVHEEAKLYWKPVENGVWNLTCSACDTHLGCREDAKYCPECGAKFVYPKAVMPEPPKGD